MPPATTAVPPADRSAAGRQRIDADGGGVGGQRIGTTAERSGTVADRVGRITGVSIRRILPEALAFLMAAKPGKNSASRWQMQYCKSSKTTSTNPELQTSMKALASAGGRCKAMATLEVPIELKAVDEAGNFEAYAAVFNNVDPASTAMRRAPGRW